MGVIDHIQSEDQIFSDSSDLAQDQSDLMRSTNLSPVDAIVGYFLGLCLVLKLSSCLTCRCFLMCRTRRSWAVASRICQPVQWERTDSGYGGGSGKIATTARRGPGAKEWWLPDHKKDKLPYEVAWMQHVFCLYIPTE